MKRLDAEYRDFVAAFADPLARLAYLLMAGASEASTASGDTLTVNALARVRRHWREAETTGAPEPLAVEALLSSLPRRRATNADRSSGELASAEMAAGELASAEPATSDEADSLVHDAAWTVWRSLEPRQRVPILLADLSVASRRLRGLDIPDSFRSQHRRNTVAADSLGKIRAGLLHHIAARPRVEAMSDPDLVTVLAETLREHASTVLTAVDPYPAVIGRVQRNRRVVAAVAAVVVVLLPAGVLTTIRVSAPAKPGAVGILPDGDGADRPVVDWPTRGNAAADVDVVAALKDDLAHTHSDTLGQAQVLLLADTPLFRVAYVTAHTLTGVLGSWFYGAPGSKSLVEGSFDERAGLSRTSVLATGVRDGIGNTVFVVIAPPDTTTMQLSDRDVTAPPGSSFEQLPDQDGVAVQYLPSGAVSGLVLKVGLPTGTLEFEQLPTVVLVGL